MGLTGFLTATAHGVDIKCQPHGIAHGNDLAVNPMRDTFLSAPWGCMVLFESVTPWVIQIRGG